MATSNKNRRRKIGKLIYFSDAEWQMIKARMQRCGYTQLSDYARHMLIDGGILVVDDAQEVKALTQEINAIGNNINQIAHVANTTGCIPPKDVDTLKDLMISIWGQLRSIYFGDQLDKQKKAEEKIAEMYFKGCMSESDE